MRNRQSTQVLRLRGFPWSLSETLYRAEGQEYLLAKEQPDSYTPLIMAAYKDSGLMRYLKEEGLY